MKKKGFWNEIRKFMRYSLAFLVLLVSCGFIYQGVGASKDLKKYTAVGKKYEVFGKKMHIYTGGKGSSTVVFNAGAGTPNPTVDFYPVYQMLNNDTKYAVIDRFGSGYSDMTERKRDIDNIVEETHKLLQVSGQKPPYIMVGHSLASLETIRYAEKYPDEVKGIVLIDGGNPEYYSKQKSVVAVSHIMQFLRTSGVLRVLYSINEDFFVKARNNLKFVPNNLKEIDGAYTLIQTSNKNQIDEMRQVNKNAKKVLEENHLLEVPMTVITAGSFGDIKKDWRDSQAALSSWSKSGKQIVVKDSYHYIHHYRPDIVAGEILRLSNQ